MVFCFPSLFSCMKKQESASENESENGSENENHTGEIGEPKLPDDLMRMIISELTTQERAQFGRSCKRFRALDFDVGKKLFDSIDVQWNMNFVRIAGNAPEMKYEVEGVNFKAIEESNVNLCMFKNAKTERLKFEYIEAPHDQADFLVFSSILRSVKFEKLFLNVNCINDCSEEFIPFFTRNNLENYRINIAWTSDFSSYTFSFDKTRKLLEALPKMNKLKIEWLSRSARENADSFHVYVERAIFINEPVLLHIARVTTYAELGLVNCTAQAVIDAFEIVCQQSVHGKFLTFTLPRDTDLFQEMFALAEAKYERRSVAPAPSWIDRGRRSMIKTLVSGIVKMGKTDRHGELIEPSVAWN